MKNVLDYFFKFVRLLNKISILILSNTKIKEKPIAIRMPQGFPLSSILYLFYIAELLETCNNINNRLNASNFIDDIILLAYKHIIKENYQILKSAHNKCLDQTHQYGTFFMPEKYDLIHLFKRLKKFNMQAQLQLKDLTKAPETSV